MLRRLNFLALTFALCVVARPAISKPGDEVNVLPPFEHTVFCVRYPRECEKVEAGTALKSAPSTRWLLMNYVNHAVNNLISPKPAVPNAPEARWSISPREGDCADYAVTKRHMLIEFGWPSSSLLLAEVTLIATGEHHLVLVLKESNAAWVLDNLTPSILRVSETLTRYRWVRIESADVPKIWIKSLGPT
jgi:predicted transglutaminase-like cysteine proteinase